MARPLRSRRPPLKLSEDENIVGIKSRNNKDKITEVNSRNKESLNDQTTSATSKTKSDKGILLAGKKILTQIPRSPVLRDRTNLPAEPFKVDILVTKGAEEKTMTKITKATRLTAKRKASNDDENVAPTRAKRLRADKAKDPEPVVESIERLPLRRGKNGKAVKVKEKSREAVATKEKTRKPVAEKEKTMKAVVVVEKIQKAGVTKDSNLKVVLEKENNENASPGNEHTENASSVKVNTNNKSSEIKNTQDVLMAKEKGKNVPAKEKAKVKPTSKKLKVLKEDSESKNEDDSMVIESENAADSQNTPKARSVKAVPKKIGEVAFSKLSLSQQSNKGIENRKKKSVNRSSEPRKKGKAKATTSGSATGKKFFKNKVVDGKEILPVNEIPTSKRRKVARPRVSTSFRLRQTTLSESFAKHTTKKNLRPRGAQKNYHESTIADKTLATDKDETKRPVYKTAKLLNKSDDDGSEIYEFHFDSNDSFEKIPKRKKKVRRNVVTNKRPKASGTKKTISKPKVAAKSTVKKDEVENLQPVPPETFDKPMDNVPAIVINDFDMSPAPAISEKIRTQTKKLEPQADKVDTVTKKPQVVESLDLRGEMKINLTSTPQLTKSSENNSRPLRTTNAFNISRPSVQYRTMLSHALLNKSLSPIKKALENFDPGSPWRPPIIIGGQFSRIKNVVQSTPQVRKFSTMLESNKNSFESKTEPALVRMNKISENDENNGKVEEKSSKASEKMNKIVENDEKNANLDQKNIKPSAKMNKIAENDEKSADIKQTNFKAPAKMNQIAENDKKSANVERTNIRPMAQKVLGLAKSPRKFGTVISNVNIAIPNSNPIGIIESNAKSELNRGSPQKNPTVTSPQRAEISDTRISYGNDFDDHADKENSIPAFTSPKKSLKSPKKLIAKHSPLRPLNQAKMATKENWEPQPGPSGLQKRNPLNESRILRQSNLNNFLNIDEVPTGTSISTAHGLFADAHSTPIPGKTVKSINTEANVDNAFGFDDIGESDVELSPMKNDLFADAPTGKVAKKIFEKRTKIEGKTNIIVPSRFSIGEIKKHLRPIVSKSKAKADPVERIEKNENRDKKEEKVVNEKGKEDDTFSDTFDVLTAAAEANDKENLEEVPLFADLEPVHFKQPPRHSYKRKRIAAFNFSEDEEDNEDKESRGRLENNPTKKKKISKVEKERKKQMDEWAKSLNNTFDEIEEFDLVVEKQ